MDNFRRINKLGALLQSVRVDGDWEEWIAFFLEGVAQVATEAVETAQQMLVLFQQHQQKVHGLGRTVGSALRLLDHLQRHRVSTASTAAAAATGMSFNTVARMFATLESLGLVAPGDGRKYGKYYAYTDYHALLNRDA